MHRRARRSTQPLGGMRPFIALLLSPLVVLVPAIFRPSDWGFFAFLTFFYAYPLTLVGGVPAYLVFRRKGWLRLWQVVGAGAAIGVVAATLVGISLVPMSTAALFPRDGELWRHLSAGLGLLATGAGLGSAIAFTFWVVAVMSLTKASHAT